MQTDSADSDTFEFSLDTDGSGAFEFQLRSKGILSADHQGMIDGRVRVYRTDSLLMFNIPGDDPAKLPGAGEMVVEAERRDLAESSMLDRKESSKVDERVGC